MKRRKLKAKLASFRKGLEESKLLEKERVHETCHKPP
jgi:hypothetical protein